MQRFDTDGNGVLNTEEWERARAAARDQVVAELAARPPAPRVAFLTKPADGRPFLISGSDPSTLARGLRYRAAAGLVGFIASCSALTWTLMHL